MMPLHPLHRGRRLWAAGLMAGLLVACAGTGSSGAWRDTAGPATFAGLPQTAAAAHPTASGDYLAGNFALDQGDVRSAAQFLGRALERNPGDRDLLHQVFLLTLSSGDERAALAQARRLADAGPEAEEARLLLALDAVRSGDFKEAARRLEAIGSGGIAGIVVPLLEAWAEFGAGDTDAALARLDEGGGEQALEPLHAYHRAVMLHLDGRSREAVEVMRGGAMPETGRAPLRMVRALGSMLHGAGEVDEAGRLYRDQIDLSGDSIVLEEDLAALARGETPPAPFEDAAGGMADALLGIAEALEQQRSSTRAIVYARMADFVRPGHPEAAVLIGDIFAERGNDEEAVEAYRGVDPGSPLGWRARLRAAEALYELERKDEAVELLRAMAEERPGRTEPLVTLGNLLRRDEDYQRAEVAYSRAIERIGGGEELERRHWPLLYSRGIAFERTKRWPQAEADFLKALELEPEQPFVLNYLGYSWVEQGMNLERAQDMLRRAVELRPNDGFIVDSLGWVYYRLGDYEAAVEQLEQAVELEPGDPVINDHLGDAYWRVGRHREARFQWQRALSLEPEADDAAKIENKLRDGLPDVDPDAVQRG